MYVNGKCSKQPKLHHAILKYGWDNFQKEIIDCYHGDDVKSGLDALETYYITKFDCVKSGYNCQPIGGSALGIKRSAETKAKMSSALKGKKRPADDIARMIARQTGIKQSEVTKAKRSASLLGRPRSQAAKDAISNGHKKRLLRKKLEAINNCPTSEHI